MQVGRIYTAGSDDPTIPVERIFREPLAGGKIYINQTKAVLLPVRLRDSA